MSILMELMNTIKTTLLAFSIAIIFIHNGFAQDAYHQSVLDFLAADYNITTEDWIFSDTELGIYNEAIGYGGNFLTTAAQDQIFDQQVNCSIPSAGENPWNAGWKLTNNMPIDAGDKILVLFYLKSSGLSGKVDFFVEDNVTFDKEVFLGFDVNDEWQTYMIPFESADSYALNTSGWGFHLATKEQDIEIGGFTALNFKNTVDLEDLPSMINNEFYAGYEPDAPWRAEAAQRIESLRKANLNIKVTNMAGAPIENLPVRANMLRHEFDFGTAVVASRLGGNPLNNASYADKLTDLDGKGHGFNSVVFENDLKWDGWEEEWFVNKTQLASAVDFLTEADLEIRGHTLVWPGNQFLPEDIPQNYNDLGYVKERIFEHIETIMTYPGIGTEVNEWDVLNEVVINQDVANAFAGSPGYTTGRELYVEIFNKAMEVNPEAELWLNDYVTMTVGNVAGNATYERLKSYTQELIDAGVKLDGIGFQAHIGAAPNSIYDVIGTLDDFYDSFGTKAKITEFDLPTFIDPDLAGDYLRDFMTAVYSHPSAEGFLFWSFWDGQTYMNTGANLYREDWTETPAHASFVDLLFNEWWTEMQLISDDAGLGSIRGFKGDYEISYVCNGEPVTEVISLTQDMDFNIVCDNFTSSVNSNLSVLDVDVFPNPTAGEIRITRQQGDEMEIRIMDVMGRVKSAATVAGAQVVLNTNLSDGLYFLECSTEKGKVVKKLKIVK